MVARYFLDGGFRNFGIFTTSSAWGGFAASRCAGFTAELSEARYGCKVFTNQYAHEMGSGWVKNRQEMDRWVRSLKKPAAVMCVHDIWAQQVAWSCQRVGLRVPDDVAIVGAGNEGFFCRMCTPPLSSVDPNIRQVGYEAAKLLDAMLHGAKPPKT